VILQDPVLQHVLSQTTNKDRSMGVVHLLAQYIANAAADLVTIAHLQLTLIVVEHSPYVVSWSLHNLDPLIPLVLE